MPLLTSPIDGAPMKQIVRYGIELDVCPTTGGVWLDKGELEKLLAFVQEATDDGEEDFARFKKAKSSGRIDPEEYRPDPRYAEHHPYSKPRWKHDDDDYDDYHKYKHSKKSKLKSILDLLG